MTREPIVYYPQEINNTDIVGDDRFVLAAIEEFGYRIARGTAAGVHRENYYEQQFRRRIERQLPIKHAVEIGTWRGVSSAILAHYADKVTTIDVRYYEEASRLWMWAGVLQKIDQCVVKDDAEKAKICEALDFDFAFVDGMHKYDYVARDFECVKKCGRVLFHDYWSTSLEVMQFIDTLENVESDEPFALWKPNGYYTD